MTVPIGSAQGFHFSWYAGAGVLLVLVKNNSSWQQQTSKIPAKYQQIIYFLFFSKKIFLKYFFFANFVLLSHLGTKANFYLKLILVLGGTKKMPFLVKIIKKLKFSNFLETNFFQQPKVRNAKKYQETWYSGVFNQKIKK